MRLAEFAKPGSQLGSNCCVAAPQFVSRTSKMPRTTRGLHMTFSSFHLSWSFPSDHRLNNAPEVAPHPQVEERVWALLPGSPGQPCLMAVHGVVPPGFESNNECSFMQMSAICSSTRIIPWGDSRRCVGFWQSLRLCAITSNCAAKR